MVHTYIKDDNGYHISFNTTWGDDDPDYIAEDAAKDFHDNHDGWESSWPVKIEVFSDGKSLGSYTVEREYEPTFCAACIEYGG